MGDKKSLVGLSETNKVIVLEGEPVMKAFQALAEADRRMNEAVDLIRPYVAAADEQLNSLGERLYDHPEADYLHDVVWYLDESGGYYSSRDLTQAKTALGKLVKLHHARSGAEAEAEAEEPATDETTEEPVTEEAVVDG